MGNIGIWEIVIIAILVVIIFGGRKLPELGRGLGQGLANFRKAMSDKDTAEEKPTAVEKDEPPATDVHTKQEKPEAPPRSGPEK